MSIKTLIDVLESGINYREVRIDCCKKCNNSHYELIDNRKVLLCDRFKEVTHEVKETCVCDTYNQ